MVGGSKGPTEPQAALRMAMASQGRVRRVETALRMLAGVSTDCLLGAGLASAQ
jgi:hypothetical protein